MHAAVCSKKRKKKFKSTCARRRYGVASLNGGQPVTNALPSEFGVREGAHIFFLKCREIKKGEESEVQRESEHDIHAI